MRLLAALLACFCAAAPAFAESRMFIVANEANGYGVDRCLARGEACGTAAARAYCHTRQFAEAVAFRKVDPDEITGAVPRQSAACTGSTCGNYIAITCHR